MNPRPASSVKSHTLRIPRVDPWALWMELCTRGHSNPPLPRSHLPDATRKAQEMKGFFVPREHGLIALQGPSPALTMSLSPERGGPPLGTRKQFHQQPIYSSTSLMKLPRRGQLAPRSAGCCTLLPGISIFLCKLASTQVPQTGTAG